MAGGAKRSSLGLETWVKEGGGAFAIPFVGEGRYPTSRSAIAVAVDAGAEESFDSSTAPLMKITATSSQDMKRASLHALAKSRAVWQ